MAKLPRVIRAEYRGDHRLQVWFASGETGIVDFTAYLHGQVFEPLRSIDYFQRFFVSGGTVCWPNGADLAPEELLAAAQRSAA